MWFSFHSSWLELLLALILHILIGTVPYLKKIHPARLFCMLEKFLDGVLREKMAFELKRAGGVLTFLCVITAAVAGWLLSKLGFPVRILIMSFAFSFAGVMSWPAKAAKALRIHDISSARRVMAKYVKADVERMTEREGVTVSVLYMGHSMCDALFAPLFWITLFSLFGLGVQASLVWICIDTLDTRLGNRARANEDFGYIPAKVSDIVGFIPGFIGGWSVICAGAVLRMDFRHAIRIMDRDHKAYSSPNGGWAVSALSGVLGIQLGGDIRIHGVVMHRRLIGDNIKLPEPEDITRALKILYIAAAGALIISVLVLAAFC